MSGVDNIDPAAPGRHRWAGQWRRLRLRILARDNWQCQIRGDNCTGYADTVDHVIHRSRAPWLEYDETNLRASCKPCQHDNMPTARVIEPGPRHGW